MSGACGKRGGKVLKLFKKPLSLNGSSPSLTIENRMNVVAWYRFGLTFLPEKSGTRLADVLK